MNSFPQRHSLVISVAIISLLAGGLLGIQFEKISAKESNVAVSASSTLANGDVKGIGQMPSKVAVDQDVEFRQFWEVWQTLKSKYYQQPIKDKTLFYGAMSGLASSLGDPYTMYFEPKLADEFQQALSGKFEGIGAELSLKDEVLTIIAPLPETPAEKAGIRAGDLIAKIDGTDTTGMSVEKAVSLIRGTKGTKVVLTLFRPTEAKKGTFDVTIIRDEIQVKSVITSYTKENIAKIEITHFNEDTEAGFNAAVEDVLKKKPKGLIIDLRNNPGGFLDTSLFVAGEWVGDDVVVKERRQGQIFAELRGTGHARLANIPTVVLVNQGSASASEIVAGALQDHKKAVILGMKTFGKGSVQDYQNFKDGSGIKITIAEWLTPNERTINKTGLEPDVQVDRTAEDYEKQRDPQLERAIGILTGTAPTSSRDALAPVTPSSTKP